MIRFIRPTIPPPERWVPYLEEAYAVRQFSNFGPVHHRFEEELTRRYCEPGRRAVLASSATSALTATLLAMGVEGNVVIPSFTFPATLQAVLQAGCNPLVLDVDRETWELAPDRVDEQIEQRSDGLGAIVPVRTFGLCRDLHVWKDLGDRYGIPVIVDAAAALGGSLQTQVPVGNDGTAEVFSLHATKVFGIGEGGVAFVPEALTEAFRRATNFGLPVEGSLKRGLNGKLSEFHAAIGLAVLADIDELIARRNRVAATYREHLSSMDGLTFPHRPGLPPWQSFPLLLPESLDGADLVRLAGDEGLELRGYYRPPLHAVLRRESGTATACPETERLARHMVCLPVYSDMAQVEIEEVVRRTKKALSRLVAS